MIIEFVARRPYISARSEFMLMALACLGWAHFAQAVDIPAGFTSCAADYKTCTVPSTTGEVTVYYGANGSQLY